MAAIDGVGSARDPNSEDPLPRAEAPLRTDRDVGHRLRDERHRGEVGGFQPLGDTASEGVSPKPTLKGSGRLFDRTF
jgi:hypothetical protein